MDKFIKGRVRLSFVVIKKIKLTEKLSDGIISYLFQTIVFIKNGKK